MRGSPVFEQWEDTYLAHYGLLCRVASCKFGVPSDQAQAIAQDVFIEYMHSAAMIQDARAWLVAATCNASRNYWRSESRLEPLAEAQLRYDPDGVTAIEQRAMTSHALTRLKGRCRDAVRLRYLEGCSMKEVATRLGTTPGYAEKLVRVGIQRIKEAR